MYVCRVAAEWRATFNKDVVIDLVSRCLPDEGSSESGWWGGVHTKSSSGFFASAGELQALWSQRDGRAHVHPAAHVQADPPAGARVEEVLGQADCRGRGDAAGV